MKLEGRSLLGFSQAASSGSPAPAINPATGSRLDPGFFSATTSDVKRAAELAAEAFVSFRAWSGARRAALLQAIASSLEGEKRTIVERAHLETALPLPRLEGEMARTCGQLRLFAGLIEDGWWQDARIDHGDRNRTPAPKPDLRSLLRPIGPVAVFGASNFPLAFSVAGGDTASALAAGCPVVVKAHEGHPGVSELVGRAVVAAARESKAPEGTFSLLQGGREVGISLITQPEIRAVGFTGSFRAGRAMMEAAAARPDPIPVFAEMGSINPVFILRNALTARAHEIAAGLHGSVTLGVGQFCTNPGLVLLEQASSEFADKLTTLMEGTPAGPMLTAAVHRGFQEGVDKFSKATGMRTAVRNAAGEGQAGATLFATEAADFLRDASLMDEVFGPSTLVVSCSSKEEMLSVARALKGQLTATVHGTAEDLAANRELLSILEGKVGRLLFNGFPTGVEVSHAIQHGGPYPATSDERTTSVGTRAILRFVRPVCFQDFPDEALPPELQEANPLRLRRLVDGKLVG